MTDQKEKCKELEKALKEYADPKTSFHAKANIAVAFFEKYTKELV